MKLDLLAEPYGYWWSSIHLALDQCLLSEREALFSFSLEDSV